MLHDIDAGPRALRQLAEEMRSGQVDTLVITAWNPVYTAPFDLNLREAFASVPNSIYRGLYLDDGQLDLVEGLIIDITAQKTAETGRLAHVVRVGVLSDEGPAEIAEEADVRVDGTDGVTELLRALAGA